MRSFTKISLLSTRLIELRETKGVEPFRMQSKGLREILLFDRSRRLCCVLAAACSEDIVAA